MRSILFKKPVRCFYNSRIHHRFDRGHIGMTARSQLTLLIATIC